MANAYTETDRIRAAVIGLRIQEIRKIKNLPRNYIAGRVGVSEVQLQKYETGKVVIPIIRLEKIARILNVRLYDILSEETITTPTLQQARINRHNIIRAARTIEQAAHIILNGLNASETEDSIG